MINIKENRSQNPEFIIRTGSKGQRHKGQRTGSEKKPFPLTPEFFF